MLNCAHVIFDGLFFLRRGCWVSVIFEVFLSFGVGIGIRGPFNGWVLGSVEFLRFVRRSCLLIGFGVLRFWMIVRRDFADCISGDLISPTVLNVILVGVRIASQILHFLE
jgi:hypothetical protein